MKPSEKYKYWVMLSDYDIETAKVLIDNEKWVYVAYMCHQALERQLKGMYVYYINKEAPKTHNLAFLFDKLNKSEGFPLFGSIDKQTRNKYEDFFTVVTFYYVSDYPFSYKSIAGRFIDEKTGKKLYKEVVECVEFLRSLQPKPEKVDIKELQKTAD